MKATERFSDRVSDYVSYRPSYPIEVLEKLGHECGLDENSVIADIGSGTGIFTEQLLSSGFSVFAVEPNKEMREAAESLLGKYQKFNSVEGCSEQTGLADGSVDLLTAAQAFHWFSAQQTRTEFDRIIKPGGHVALIWNERDTSTTFQREYDQLLHSCCAEYSKVNHRNISEEKIEDFFDPYEVSRHTFQNSQQLDVDSFLGRMYSSSYTPRKESADGEKLTAASVKLHNKHQQGGVIEFTYKTSLYLSTIE